MPPREATGAPLLVVEDDGDYRTTVCEVLEEEGYRVQGAAHGGEALALMRAGSIPALILLDLLMPVMNGWAFMAELRKDPQLASIPVVVISEAGERVLSSAPVSAGYLAKPASRERLVQTISRCLQKRRSS